MSATRLSEQQLNYFNTFGYLYFPGLMADCIDRIIEEFEAVWAVHGGGHHGKEEDFQNALANEGRFWIDRIHGEAMLRTAGPERMVHLQQVIDNDFKMAEVHQRHRRENAEPSRG